MSTQTPSLRIRLTLLILHSRPDKMVPVSQALRLAQALEENGKVFQLHIYDNDMHPLPLNREDRNRMILDWFSRNAPAAAPQ